VRARAAALVVVLVAGVGLSGAPALAAPDNSAPFAPQCDPLKPGGTLAGTPWAQTRLNFQRAWQVTVGKGVVVGVIDTGLDNRHPQMRGTRIARGRNVIGAGYTVTDVRDCSGTGHGTSVTSVIAAQHLEGVPFAGVAPGVTIVPIKQTNTSGDKSGTAAGIADGIEAAIAAKVRVVNISVTVPNPGAKLRAAVAHAAKANLVIVAAAGNDGQGNNFAAYPAAYSTDFPNVIAVSASDAKDAIGQFADTGNYVTVAAPGVDVVIPAPISGYTKVDGTSFAAPYVTGTVALVLAAHPAMTAAQVRNRIEATADRPPATVPDQKYGYGIVNPYLAVTAVRDDTAPVPSARPAPPLPALAVARPADRHLAHVALASAIVLLGLAVLAAAAAGVLRGQSRRRGVSTAD
jgi:membrane-anchored mycosin MYCP